MFCVTWPHIFIAIAAIPTECVRETIQLNYYNVLSPSSTSEHGILQSIQNNQHSSPSSTRADRLCLRHKLPPTNEHFHQTLCLHHGRKANGTEGKEPNSRPSICCVFFSHVPHPRAPLHPVRKYIDPYNTSLTNSHFCDLQTIKQENSLYHRN
ncbi:unnamed protein product [Ectocarpus sp. 13 AM-2016]